MQDKHHNNYNIAVTALCIPCPRPRHLKTKCTPCERNLLNIISLKMFPRKPKCIKAFKRLIAFRI